MVGELLAKSMPFVFLPYLTRMLGADQFGELSLILAWIGFFSIFVTLTQHGAIARYYYRYGKKGLYQLTLVGIKYSLLISSMLFLVGVLLKNTTILLVSLYCFSSAFFSAQLTLRQCQKKAIEYITLQMASSFLAIILTVLLFEFFHANISNRLLSVIFSNVFCAILAFGLFFSSGKGESKRSSKKTERLLLKYILVFGAPLIFHQLSIYAKGAMDRVLIDEFSNVSNKELGLYAAAYQLSSIIQIVLVSINKAVVPYYYQALKNKVINEGVILKYSLLSLFIPPLIYFLLSFIPESWYLLYLGDSFLGVKHFVVVFSSGISMNLSYFILVNYFFYESRTSLVAKVNLFSAAVHIILVISFSNVDISLVPFSLIVSNLVLILGLAFVLSSTMFRIKK